MLLAELAPTIRPDAIVLVFFLGNDIVNNAIELAGAMGG